MIAVILLTQDSTFWDIFESDPTRRDAAFARVFLAVPAWITTQLKMQFGEKFEGEYKEIGKKDRDEIAKMLTWVVNRQKQLLKSYEEATPNGRS